MSKDLTKKIYCISFDYKNDVTLESTVISTSDEDYKDFVAFEEYEDYVKEEMIAEAEQHFCPAICLDDNQMKQLKDKMKIK